MKINKKIDQYYLILNELKQNTGEEFSTEDLIKATKDLIKYSQNDFIHKSFIKDHDNDNRKPLDRIFRTDKDFIPEIDSVLTFEDRDIEELESYRKFNLINNGCL